MHEPGTHETWLKRHIYRAARKPPAVKLTRRLLEREKLCMSCRVVVDFATVVRPGDDFAIAGDDSPDGYLTE